MKIDFPTFLGIASVSILCIFATSVMVFENNSYSIDATDSSSQNNVKRDAEVLECDRTILAHLAKYSNLLDDDFDGNFAINLIGLPDGVSEEKFEWCVDFIYEKRFPSNDTKSEKLKLEAEPSLASEYDYNFDKTWGGLGNRHPAFLGYHIPEICTEDMIKHLVKYSSMFDRNVPYTLEWISMDDSINVDDFDRCVEELLERNPKELENEN